MSEKNTTINVQPVLDIQSLHEQLSKQKFKVNVDVDTSAINSQIQSSIGQVTANMQPAKIPIEADTKGIMDYISDFNSIYTTINNLSNTKNLVSKSLD